MFVQVRHHTPFFILEANRHHLYYTALCIICSTLPQVSFGLLSHAHAFVLLLEASRLIVTSIHDPCTPHSHHCIYCQVYCQGSVLPLAFFWGQLRATQRSPPLRHQPRLPTSVHTTTPMRTTQSSSECRRQPVITKYRY